MAYNVLRIGDGAALTRKLSYYKLIFGTSKMVKLARNPHYCQYDVGRRFYLILLTLISSLIPSTFIYVPPDFPNIKTFGE